MPLIAIADPTCQLVTDSAYYLQEVMASTLRADALFKSAPNNDIHVHLRHLDFLVERNVWFVHSTEFPSVTAVGAGGVKAVVSEGKMYKWSVYLALSIAFALTLKPKQKVFTVLGDFNVLLNEARSVCEETFGDLRQFQLECHVAKSDVLRFNRLKQEQSSDHHRSRKRNETKERGRELHGGTRISFTHRGRSRARSALQLPKIKTLKRRIERRPSTERKQASEKNMYMCDSREQLEEEMHAEFQAEFRVKLEEECGKLHVRHQEVSFVDELEAMVLRSKLNTALEVAHSQHLELHTEHDEVNMQPVGKKTFSHEMEYAKRLESSFSTELDVARVEALQAKGNLEVLQSKHDDIIRNVQWQELQDVSNLRARHQLKMAFNDAHMERLEGLSQFQHQDLEHAHQKFEAEMEMLIINQEGEQLSGAVAVAEQLLSGGREKAVAMNRKSLELRGKKGPVRNRVK